MFIEKCKYEDLRYWSNSLGELHFHGKYDITEDELPIELKKAYSDIWSDSTGSLCYLAEYRGKYKVSLENEFDAYFAEEEGMELEDVLKKLRTKAEIYSQLEEFQDCDILIQTCSGIAENWTWHDLIVLLPWNINRERFDQIGKILNETVYNMDDAEITQYLSSCKKAKNVKEKKR